YNHRTLRAELGAPYAFATDSDCEVILPLYREHGPAFLDRLRGMFAFVLVDEARDRWMIARDPIGIIPLYVGRTAEGALAVSSELKGLLDVCTTVRELPPGHYQTSDDEAPVRYYERAWFDYDAVPDGEADPAALREALRE